MNLTLLIPIVASFLITLLLIPVWIKKARDSGILWEDMNKINAPKVAGSGGVVVLLGFTIGALIFVAYETFYARSATNLEIFSALTVIIFLAAIGLIDDILGWHRGGLSRLSRMGLCLLASIPLIVINAGKHIISLPIIGHVDLGLIYPFVLIPIGIVGATTTFNFLAGFNGLEAGQGILMLAGLSIVAFFTGTLWISVICLCMVAALLGFIFYNAYPAKVFPGDSLTYSVGGLIATAAILGNFEKIAVFFFIPTIIEVILKSRGKLIKHSFGKPNHNGGIDLPYDKWYSLNHVAISLLKKIGLKSTERNVVYTIWAFQLVIIIVGLFIFREGIFL